MAYADKDKERAYQRAWNKKNRPNRREYMKLWARENARKANLNGKLGRPGWYALLNGARQRGLEVSIEYEDIVVPSHCPVLGLPLDRRDYNHCPSVDRIDSNKGYIKGNIVVVSRRVNNLKSNATLDELKAMVRFYEGLE